MEVFFNGSSFVSKKEIFLFLKMGVCFLKGRTFSWLTLGWIMMPAVPEMDISLKIESTNCHAIGNLMLFMNTNVIMLSFVVNGSKGIMSLIWKVARKTQIEVHPFCG